MAGKSVPPVRLAVLVYGPQRSPAVMAGKSVPPVRLAVLVYGPQRSPAVMAGKRSDGLVTARLSGRRRNGARP